MRVFICFLPKYTFSLFDCIHQNTACRTYVLRFWTIRILKLQPFESNYDSNHQKLLQTTLSCCCRAASEASYNLYVSEERAHLWIWFSLYFLWSCMSDAAVWELPLVVRGLVKKWWSDIQKKIKGVAIIDVGCWHKGKSTVMVCEVKSSADTLMRADIHVHNKTIGRRVGKCLSCYPVTSWLSWRLPAG